MKPYSKEFRGQVLAARDKGRSTREVATSFDVSESWVRRIKQERRELNKTAPFLKRRRVPDVAERREELRREQPLLNPERLILIDDTWATTNMTRPRGRALRGQRLLASVPHGHWKTTTFLAALGTTGLTAPLVVDGATRLLNGQVALEERVSQDCRDPLIGVQRRARSLHGGGVPQLLQALRIPLHVKQKHTSPCHGHDAFFREDAAAMDA